jgi:hypothetical protein
LPRICGTASRCDQCEQYTCQRVRFAVQLEYPPLRSPQTLIDIPCFLVRDGGVRILEYQPVFGCGLAHLGSEGHQIVFALCGVDALDGGDQPYALVA